MGLRQASNRKKHGVSFEEAKSAFSDEHGRLLDDSDHSEHEQRFSLLGMSSARYARDHAVDSRGAWVDRVTMNAQSEFLVRSFHPADQAALESLWQDVFPDDPPWNAPEVMIEKKLRMQPELLLVGELAGSIVGALMAGFDGVRGWLSRSLRFLKESTMQESKAAPTRFEHAHPILRVTDMTRSLRYYVDVLGFSSAEWGGDDFTCVTRDGANIYLSQGDQGHPGTWVWLGVEDVEALHEEYKQAGATILQAPQNFPWACEMKVGDPDGHVLRFGSDPKGDS